MTRYAFVILTILISSFTGTPATAQLQTYDQYSGRPKNQTDEPAQGIQKGMQIRQMPQKMTSQDLEAERRRQEMRQKEIEFNRQQQQEKQSYKTQKSIEQLMLEYEPGKGANQLAIKRIYLLDPALGERLILTEFRLEQAKESTSQKTKISRTASVFSGPGGVYEHLGQLTVGTKIQPLEERNGWYRFTSDQFPRGNAWVHSSFTEEEHE